MVSVFLVLNFYPSQDHSLILVQGYYEIAPFF